MGIFKKLGSGLKNTVKGAVKSYKDYQDKAPEREAKKLKQLKSQEQLLKARAGVMTQQNKIRNMQAQQMANNPFFGGSPGFGSNNPFEGQPVKRAAPKKKSSGSKPKRKEVFYY